MGPNLATQKKPALVLVDGSSYLYRAYHALPSLTAADGQPTGAIKGVVGMLRKLCQQYADSDIAVIFDAKGKTFRDDIYKDYKSNRPPMPDDLKTQIVPLHEIITAMGLPLLSVSGVEADDVIGTLARSASEKGLQILISTGDKDLAQLVSTQVTLVNTMKKEYFLDPEGVKKKFGIGPELIIDFLALMGDASDNIPGVPGVGKKTALALLQNLGSLNNIYENLDDIATLSFRGAKSLPAKMAKNRELAYLSYQLATIKTDLNLDLTEDDLKNKPVDQETLNKLFARLGFKESFKELQLRNEKVQPSGEPLATQGHYETVLTKLRFDHWLEQLKNAALFAFDTETTGLNYMMADIVGVSFSIKAGEAAYVPFGHDYDNAPIQLDLADVLDQLKPLLEDPEVLKVGQNIKYDQNILARSGIYIQGFVFDTMLESYVLNATATRHNMDALAARYLNHTTISFEEVAGKGKKQLTFNKVPLEQAGPYAAEDADITLQLHETLWPQVSELSSLKSVFETIEMPLVPVLSAIERAGVLIDTDSLQQQSADLEVRLSALEEQAFILAGEAFNLSSPKQLQEILFSKLQLPMVKKTPKGQPSTAEDVLEELAINHELPAVLLEFRGLYKLKSTYTDKLPLMVNQQTCRVHTSYHQGVVATGRLSSTDPNLQNIPIKNEEGRKVRQAFIAPKGYSLLAADYSQIELRIMAHLAQDQVLCTAFQEGKDIHQATAAEVFGISEDAVTTEQRRSAKAINFGLIYGMSAFGLAKQLGIPRSDAQYYINLYFSRYPSVKAYMEDTREKAKAQGYVETIFGRRLYLPDITSRNGIRRQAAERAAINAPMQGTAADLIKLAMVQVHHWLQQQQMQSGRIIMQVHDELVLEVNNSVLGHVSAAVKNIMEQVASLAVPLVVDLGTGTNWEAAH